MGWELGSESEGLVNMDLTPCRTHSTKLLSPSTLIWATERQTVVRYQGVLLRNKREWATDVLTNVVESQMPNDRWREPNLKASWYVIPFIWPSRRGKMIGTVSYFDWGGSYMTVDVEIAELSVNGWIVCKLYLNFLNGRKNTKLFWIGCFSNLIIYLRIFR